MAAKFSLIERRSVISRTAMTLAIMFGTGFVVAVLFGGVPTWQNHGPEAGPGFVRRAIDPEMYYSLTVAYGTTAGASLIAAFFRFRWVTITHVRLFFIGTLLLLIACFLYVRSVPTREERAKEAWNRIESLGGHGVWDSDMVVVSLADTGITDDDLALFADFPDVQILDLSNNPLTDDCLKHLDDLKDLDSLILIGTAIRPKAIADFRMAHPDVDVRTTVSDQL